MMTFRCKLFDRRNGKEIGPVSGETVKAATKTDARKILEREWKRDTPRAARAHGFVPWSDVKIVWNFRD